MAKKEKCDFERQLDELKAQFRTCMKKYQWDNNASLSLYYSRVSMTVRVSFTHNMHELLAVTLDNPNIAAIEGYLEVLTQHMERAHRMYRQLLDQAGQDMAKVEYAAPTFAFTSHRLGVCKYANLGYTRYAWVRLGHLSRHGQWIKLFFNRTEILYDKSFTELERLRKRRLPKVRGGKGEAQTPKDNPPHPWLVDTRCILHATTYLHDHDDEIFKALGTLPLNRAGVREDIDWGAGIVMVMQQFGDELVTVRRAEMGAAKNLYLAIFPNVPFSANCYALKMGDPNARPIKISEDAHVPTGRNNYGDPKFEKYGGIRPGSYFAVFHGKINGRRMAYMFDPIDKGDEYVSVVLKTLIDRYILGKE